MAKNQPERDDNEFKVSPLDVKDHDFCLDMAVDAFTSRNALVVHLQVPPDELRSIFLKDTKESVKQGLCMVAKNKNGDIVGFLFCNQCDFMLPDADMTPRHSMLRHSYDVGEALYHRAARNTSIGLAQVARGETLHVICGCSAKGYEGKGIGTLLRSKLLPFAQNRGFSRILVEAVSPATIHIWTKLGYKVRSKTTLATFKGENGIKHFEDIDPPDAEYVIFEGIVNDEQTSIFDRLFSAFWLGVIVCKCRRWFKPYVPPAETETLDP
jgi:GNAT superfamily N-acetyltransferase